MSNNSSILLVSSYKNQADVCKHQGLSLLQLIVIFPNNMNLPGKNPGTSTNVTMGILKASQNRTKRAPFTEALISRQPDEMQEVFMVIQSHSYKVTMV